MTIKPITAPAMLKTGDTLEWLVDEGSMVTAGDILAVAQPEAGRKKDLVVIAPYSGKLTDLSSVVIYSGRHVTLKGIYGRSRKKLATELLRKKSPTIAFKKSIMHGPVIANIRITNITRKKKTYQLLDTSSNKEHHLSGILNRIYGTDSSRSNTTQNTLTSALIGGTPMAAKTETTLKRLVSHWSAKFTALHQEADQAIQKHQEVERRLEESMERRRVSSELEL